MRENRQLPSPDGLLTNLWASVPGHIRLTFLSAILCGLFAHLYMLTNKLPNHDDVGHLFEMDYGTASGRWLLPLVTKLDGTYSMPWLIGVISLAALAVVACLTVSVLRIRRPAGCILTAALLTVFPTTAATFTYMFSADAYFISTALAVFGAYAALRWHRLGSLVGIAAITCSMGIYQSYFGIAAALMVGALILQVLDGKKEIKALLLDGVRLVVVLGLSVAAYMVIVKLSTRTMGLVDYMGISSMGKLSLKQLPHLIWSSYKKFFTFYFQNDMSFHFNVMKYLFAATVLAVLVLFGMILWRRKLGVLRTVLAVVLLLLLPLAANIIYVMVPNFEIHTLMLYGLVIPPVIALALAEYACALQLSHAQRGVQSTLAISMSWIIVLTAAASAYSYIIVDNKAYFKMDISYQQTYAYSNRLLSAIEAHEDYNRDLPVALVGHVDEASLTDPTPALDQVNLAGVADLAGYRGSYTYGYMLRYLLGFPNPVYIEGNEPVTALSKLPAVIKMPSYPAAGSIQLVDDTIVVKLGPSS